MQIPAPETTLPDEAQTLLCLGRVVVDSQDREKLHRLLGRSLDWARIVQMAENHGVLPLLYRNLSHGFKEAAPGAFFTGLRDRFRTNAQANLILAAELLHLLGLLDEHGIQTVPLRGPVMGEWLYGDLSLRQTGDLDLLIRKHHVIQVKEILLSMGYRPFFPWPKDENTVFSRGEYAFVREPGNIMIDLHWKTGRVDLAIPNPPDFWNRLETIPFEGRSIPTLSLQDQILLMSVHGTKHNWRRLIWLCDVARLIRRSKGMNWPLLLAQARAIGILRMVSVGLHLANSCLRVDLPQEFWNEVGEDPVTERLANRFLGTMFQETADSTPSLEDPLLFIQCMDNRRDQIRYLLQRTFAPTPWTPGTKPMRSGLFFLKYLMRPVQMAKTYALPFMRRRYYHDRSGK